MSQPQDLPPYIRRESFEEQQTFFDLFFAVMQIWFNSNGFYLPSLTDAEVTAMIASLGGVYPVRLWYNTTHDTLQYIKISDGTVKTVATV